MVGVELATYINGLQEAGCVQKVEGVEKAEDVLGAAGVRGHELVGCRVDSAQMKLGESAQESRVDTPQTSHVLQHHEPRVQATTVVSTVSGLALPTVSVQENNILLENAALNGWKRRQTLIRRSRSVCLFFCMFGHVCVFLCVVVCVCVCNCS